jgi:hypothetical protein
MRERLVGVSSLRGPRRGPCQASFLELGETHMEVTNHIPNRGDQVEQRRMGISRVGVVWYADQLQVLVKWQDGKSSSLRLGRDQFSIRTAAPEGEVRRQELEAGAGDEHLGAECLSPAIADPPRT